MDTAEKLVLCVNIAGEGDKIRSLLAPQLRNSQHS